jgi:hypothetical protein
MATRTIKFIGKAYSTEGDVSVVVNFNSVEVYSGTVTTVNSECPQKPLSGENNDELFTFDISTDISGSIPLTIAVSNGTLVFFDLIGNYTGYTLETDEAGDPVIVDGAYVVDVAPVDTYGDLNLNTVESDGKNNVVIDPDQGDGQSRAVLNEEESGDWYYKVWSGSTLSCNFVIENTVTTIPTPAPTPAP